MASYTIPTVVERTPLGERAFDVFSRLLSERISFHTGQPVEQIEADSDRDRWFTAQQAKDYGIIDHVVSKRGEIVETAEAAS